MVCGLGLGEDDCDDGGGGDGGGGGTGECEDGEILDCFGNCAPAAWLGDGYCDESMTDFNCLELAYDMGDCEINFSNHVMPLITANCTGYCHSGAANYQGGLNLESYTGLMEVGHSGPAVQPYYPDYSLHNQTNCQLHFRLNQYIHLHHNDHIHHAHCSYNNHPYHHHWLHN